MRRVIALAAAVLLVLAMAGPVAADPIGKSQFPHEYVTTCDDPEAPAVPNQMAHAVPGWGLDWQAGDTPWLLMGFTIHYDAVTTAVASLPPGLVGNGKLFGPCEIRWSEAPYPYISDAFYMER